MPVAIIAASIASSISVPTSADLLEVKMQEREVIRVLPSALKAKKSSDTQIAIKVDKEIKYIEVDAIESMTVHSMDTYDATHHFLTKTGVGMDVSDLDNDALRYYSTKRYKKGQNQKALCTAAITIGAVAQPWFFAIAPLPYVQHKTTLRTYDQSQLMSKAEYKTYNNEVKASKKKDKAENKAKKKG